MKRRKWLLLLSVWTFLSAGCSQGPWSSGDRVLVSKCMYDTDISKPHRFDVVVFKYPVRPVEKGVPKNYIKRLMGLPGEILAILFGRIFVMSPEDGEEFFPEPQVLVTKDGRTFKGMVKEQDETKIIFEHVTFVRPEIAREVRQPVYFVQLEFQRDQISSLKPIDVAERWMHRNAEDLTWTNRDTRGRSKSVDETDCFNDYDFMYTNHPTVLGWFMQGKFKILRKPPEVMLATRRIVFDNDYQPKDLLEPRFRRWKPGDKSAWKADSPIDFSTEGGKAERVDWLRYQHLVVAAKSHEVRFGDKPGPRATAPAPAPQLITDFYGYNSVIATDREIPYPNWAGDLMLECTVEATESTGEFWLELSRGIDRFQARFDLASGRCTLFRVSGEGKERKTTELASQDTRVKGKGTYNVKFSNFCARLTVWVDRDLPFDQGHDYDPPDVPKPGEFTGLSQDQIIEALAARRGPTANDLEPASLGVKGAAVRVTHLRLWRDTYYTRGGSEGDENVSGAESNLKSFDHYRRLMPHTYYVQPGHYMCMGDNSTMSADSREWGLVPDRLMLGRAHAVYFPFGRAGAIK